MDTSYPCCEGHPHGCPQHIQQWLEDRRGRLAALEMRRAAGNTSFSRATFGRLS